MKRALIVLSFIACGWISYWLIMAATITWEVRHQKQAAHIAEGYNAIVQLFIKHGWLTYDEETDKVKLSSEVKPGSSLDKFYHNSYLKDDVEAFADGERSRFRIENFIIVEIDPHAHKMFLPFTAIRNWTGTLTYRPGKLRRALLQGKNAVIELIEPYSSLKNAQDIKALTLPDDKATWENRTHAQDQAVLVKGEGGIDLGKTHLIGSSVIFNNRQVDGARVDLTVSGEKIKQGNRLRIDSGDMVKLKWRTGAFSSQYALLWCTTGAEAPVISTYRSFNGRDRRIPEEVDLQYAEEIVAAMQQGFMAQNSAGQYLTSEEKNGFELALTLDETIHRETQTVLENSCLTWWRRDRAAPFRAAITVMDATTGELLALASFPTKTELADLPVSERSNRYIRNHNFSRFPIGSIAKIMLSAAIIGDAPSLATLKIPGYSGTEINQLLGITLDSPLRIHPLDGGSDNLVDLAEFIEHSSNKYGALLITLAAGVDETTKRLRLPNDRHSDWDSLPVSEQFFLGTEKHTRRPSLAMKLERDGRSSRARVDSIHTGEFLPFEQKLCELFDVERSRKIHDGNDLLRRDLIRGDDVIDTEIWIPLLQYLFGRQYIPKQHPFYRVSPERVNLAFNLVNNYRTQYLSIVLGGASSVWTNIKVCQSFSRLVTGVKTEAAVVNRIKTKDQVLIEPSTYGKFDPLPLNSELRLTLLDAMTRVAGPNGTANQLTEMLKLYDQELNSRNQVLGFFSKTGSPKILSAVPSQTNKAANALIKTGALSLNSQNLIVYREHGAVEFEMGETGVQNPWIKNMRLNEKDMSILRKYGVSPRAIVRACAAFNEGDQKDLFQVANGRLIKMGQFNLIPSVGGAYAFTIGVYDGSARRPSANQGYLPLIDAATYQPIRALTVSIIVESQGDSIEIAVPLAKTLIEEVLWNALKTDW